jgi:hypothetical protein
MLTPDEDLEIRALAAQGRSVSAIARDLGGDRKTVRAHLRSERSASLRRPSRPDPFEPFVPYARARLAQHPDLQARTLYQELLAQGFGLSYPTLTARLRGIRRRTQKPQDQTLSCNPLPDHAIGTHPAAKPHALDPADAVVVVPSDPPQLSSAATRTLLRILLTAALPRLLDPSPCEPFSEHPLAHFTKRG